MDANIKKYINSWKAGKVEYFECFINRIVYYKDTLDSCDSCKWQRPIPEGEECFIASFVTLDSTLLVQATIKLVTKGIE